MSTVDSTFDMVILISILVSFSNQHYIYIYIRHLNITVLCLRSLVHKEVKKYLCLSNAT